MVCAVVFVLLSLSRGSAPTITFGTRATSLQKVLAEVGRQSGQALRASDEIREHRVVVSLADAPLQQTLDHFALALGAEWVKAGSGYELRRTPASLARVECEEQADRESWLCQGYAKLTAVDPQWGPGRPVDDYRASKSLVIRAVELAGIDQIANLKPHSRTVFSTEPTRLQRPFGPGSERLYEQYYKDWQVAQAAEQKRGYAGITTTSHEPDPKGGPVLLLVSMEPTRVNFEIRLYNARGEAVKTDSETIDHRYGYPDKGPAIDPSLPFVPSEAGRALHEALQTGPIKVGAQLRLAIDLVTKPDEHDPLEGDPSDVVLQTAKATGANAIVALGDDSAVLNYEKEPSTLREAIACLASGVRLTFDRDNRWLTGRPRWDECFEKPNLPRRQLASVLSKALSGGGFDLENRLACASLARAGRNDSPLTWMLERFSQGDLSIWLVGDLSSAPLALAATLTPRQREQARRGLTIRLEDLTPLQRQLVESRLIGGWWPGRFHDVNCESPRRQVDYEPTIAFADSFPRGAAITIQMNTVDGLTMRSSERDGSTRYEWLTVSAAAAKARQNELAGAPAALTFQPAASFAVRVKYDLGGMGWYEDRANGIDLLRNGPWVDAKRLPERVRREFEQELGKRRSPGGKR